ncbi:MAG: tape measure protein [Bacteroides sp.]|nr:tape measure protein [Bacteroides sp.]
MSQRLHFAFTGDNSNFMARLREVQEGVLSASRRIEGAGDDIDKFFSRIRSGLAMLGVATGLKEFAQQVYSTRAAVQSLEISFSTLLGNKEKAAAMFGEIRHLAATTPMLVKDLATGAQTMLGFGIAADEVMPMLRSLGDISMGDAQKFNSLALAFSQMSATGKLMGQDLMQMVNAGFNPLNEIARTTGKTLAEVKAEQEAGRITVKMVTEAFKSATAEGGQFFNMLNNQGEGLTGAMAQLEGAVSDAFNAMGEKTEGVMATTVNATKSIVQHWEEVALALGAVAAGYGLQKAVDSLAVSLAAQAVATGSASTATNLLAVAQTNLTAAASRLWGVLAANPMMLLVTAATALGYALYKVMTAQTDYQKSLEKVSQATQTAKAESDKEIKTLDELKAKLESAVKGSDEWKSVKDAVVRQFGQYLPQLDQEITKVGNLSTAYRDLTLAIQEANAAKGLKKFLDENDNQSEVDKKWREGLHKWKKSLNGKLDPKTIAVIEPMLREYATRSASDADVHTFIRDKFKERFGLDKGAEFYAGLEYYITKSKLGDINEAHRMNATREREYQMYVDDMGISQETYKKVRWGIEPAAPEIRDGDTIDAEIKAKKEQLAKYKKDSEEYKALRKEIASLEKERQEWGSASDLKTKKQTGPTVAQLEAREESAYGKLSDIERRQQAEQARIEKDYELERWQNRIDLMKEGQRKVEEQQRLDFERQRVELARRQQQEEESELKRQMALFDARENARAAADKKYAKKTFRDSDIDEAPFDKIKERYTALYDDLAAIQKKGVADRMAAERDALDAFLIEYGSYTEKRGAIERRYAEKIRTATTDGERRRHEAEQRKELSGLDFSMLTEKGPLAAAFNDISRLTAKRVSDLIERMKEFRSTALQSFSPDQLRRFDEALGALVSRSRELEGAKSDWLSGPFRSERSEKRSQIESRQKLNTEAITQATDETRAITGRMISLKTKPEDMERLRQLTEYLQTLREEEERLNEEMEETETPAARLDDYASAVSSTIELTTQLAADVSALAGALGADGLGESLDLASKALAGVDSIIKGFKEGLLSGIVAAAATATDLIVSLFGNSDKKHQERIEELQDRVDDLKRSYERLGNAVEQAFSSDAARLISQQQRNLAARRQLLYQQIAEERAKKKSDKEAVRQLEEQISDISDRIADLQKQAEDAIFGADVRSQIERFAEAYADAWTQGESRVASARDTVREMMQQMVTESLKAAVQSSGAMEQIRQRMMQYFRDGIFDSVERQDLYQMAEELQRELDTVMGENKDLFYADSFSQNLSSKTWGAMTSEDAGVLQGRFTALCETGESIRQVNASIAEAVRANLDQARLHADLLQDSLNVQIISMGHLETISSHTRALAEMRESLSKIERHTRNL